MITKTIRKTLKMKQNIVLDQKMMKMKRMKSESCDCEIDFNYNSV